MTILQGNIFGPMSFTGQSAPDYIPAKITIIATCAGTCVFVVCLQAYYITENKRRDKLEAEAAGRDEDEAAFMDKTDRQNQGFRYQL